MTVSMHSPKEGLTPAQLREQCRYNTFLDKGTAGHCAGYTQANLIILPAEYADDFRLLCKRNPVPCPLIAETGIGDPSVPAHLVASGSSDIRTDLARYSIYENGELVEQKADITDEWNEDSIAFLIGCSHSFEGGLEAGGLELRHHTLKQVVPCYRSEVRLLPAGRFSGRMVVSMRPFLPSQFDQVRDLTAPFVGAHGEPVAYGFEGAAQLGITDTLGKAPTWGHPTVMKEGEEPVYWGCGVTPQQIVMDSKLPCRVVTHATGYMFVSDMKSEMLCT